MTLNENGLITLWKRVREYVIWYVTERLKPATSNEYGVIKVGNSLYMDDGKLQQGVQTQAIGSAAHAEGTETYADGDNSHAEGNESVASGDTSHAEGYSTTANGDSSHAEGFQTRASGDASHAEGSQAVASGNESHAEGSATEASAYCSHVEGNGSRASGESSHAEGLVTTASGDASHAEGSGSQASEDSSHAEGINTRAEGSASHAGGVRTLASAEGSFAHGENVSAESPYQTVFGRYNVPDDSDVYAFIIGNGKWRSGLSNAFAVKWNGDIECAGNLPAATSSKRGGVKPDGTTITVDDDGTIHGANTYELLPATRSRLGGVKPDGYSITVDEEGTIELGVANYLGLGGVRIREDGYIGIDDGYLYLKCDVADSDVVDSYTKDDSGEAILFPGGSAPTYLIDHNTLRRLWENVTEYVQENSGGLDDGPSIYSRVETNELYRILVGFMGMTTAMPRVFVSSSGTFAANEELNPMCQYVLMWGVDYYFGHPAIYSNNVTKIVFDLPDDQRVTITDTTGNESASTFSVTFTGDSGNWAWLGRFGAIETDLLENNVNGVGFLIRNEYATTSNAGVVKVGSGLVISDDGTLSVDMTNLNEVSF